MPKGYLAEARRYEIIVRWTSSTRPDYFLALNDIPLTRLRYGNFDSFPIEIEFYAGDLRIAIGRGDRILHTVDLFVDPDIAKLTRDEYAAMISDLAEATPAIYRLGYVTIPTSTRSGGLRSDLVTLELIRSNFDALDRAVSRIANQPVRTLRTTTFQSDILRARRIDDRAIASALRNGRSRLATASEAYAAPRLVGALRGAWIPTISETRREETVDVYENRAVLGFIQWLDGKLSELSLRLSAAAASQAISFAHRAYLRRITKWRNRLASVQRRSAFSGLRSELNLRATSIFRAHPDYASAFAAMSRMRAGLGLGGATSPPIPLEKTFELYEQWCYIGMLRAVLDRCPEARAQVRKILEGVPSAGSLGMALVQGSQSDIPLGDSVSLTYQRRFTPAGSLDGTRTHLVDAIPDMTFTKIDSEEKCVGLVIFDPKYRAGPSLFDGIRDMHMYRDAIVDSAGTRVVRAAVALAPRAGNLPESDSLPDDRPGILSLRPGHRPGAFARLLELALQKLKDAA